MKKRLALATFGAILLSASAPALASEVWTITESTRSFNNGQKGGPTSTWTGTWTFPLMQPSSNGGMTGNGVAQMTSQRTGETLSYDVHVSLYANGNGQFAVVATRRGGSVGTECAYLSIIAGDAITQMRKICDDGDSSGVWRGQVTKRQTILEQSPVERKSPADELKDLGDQPKP